MHQVTVKNGSWFGWKPDPGVWVLPWITDFPSEKLPTSSVCFVFSQMKKTVWLGLLTRGSEHGLYCSRCCLEVTLPSDLPTKQYVWY